MATTREGGAGGVRGKDGRRGNSSSTPQTKKATTKAIPSSSSSSSQSQRAVPSNLKPTMSSKLELPSFRRSTTFANSSTITTKLALVNRKQSPASSPNPQKTLGGPIKTSRSTSFPEPKTSIKPAPKRSFSALSASKSTKPASVTPSVKRSLSTKTSPISMGLRKKKTVPKNATSDSSSVELHEVEEKDPLSHMDEDEVQSLHDITEMPCHEDQLGDPVMVMQHSEATDSRVQEIQVEKQDDVRVVDEEGAEEVVKEGSTKVEDKHVVVEIQGLLVSKEDEEMKPEAQEVVKTETPSKQLTQSGSRKETQAYNDVIEETATKLMVNRSSKVRALAGAFETVISLDSK